MVTLTMMYEARCKDCIFLKFGHLINKDGTLSKRVSYSCDNRKSDRYQTLFPKRTLSCDKFALTHSDTNLNITKLDYYPTDDSNSEEYYKVRRRLERMRDLGMVEMSSMSFGIPGVMSGLYIERVWSYSNEEFNDYLDLVEELLSNKNQTL